MAPGQTPRHVRRAPLAQRLQAWLDPAELYLWASEEFSSQDWDEISRKWSNTIGIGLNLLFLLARSNSSVSSDGADIFADYDHSGSGVLSWLCTVIVYGLILLSFTNALVTFFQTKSYRLFNADVNGPVQSKAARRVRVDAAPATSSPMRLLSRYIKPAAIKDDDEEVDEVWEISVWDPSPLLLRMAILFSPAHVLVMLLFLPYSQSDPQPSVTVAKTAALCGLLSLQGHFLQSKFSQQNKDSTSIFREVSKEYGAKFVQPNAQKRPVRDVGIQFPHPGPVWDRQRGSWEAIAEVVSGSPYSSPKGFQTKPNTSYASHYDPHHLGSTDGFASQARSNATPSMRDYHIPAPSSGQITADFSSPIRQAAARHNQAASRPAYTSTGSGDGGSLGVYTHAASPLRKAASSNVLRQGGGPVGELRRREGSPLKRSSLPAEGLHQRLYNARDTTSRRTDGKY